MYQFIHSNKKSIGSIVCCLVIATITMSFQNTPFSPLDQLDTLTGMQDTIPEKATNRDGKISMKDFDQMMLNLDEENIKMKAELSKIDFDKIHKEIAASLNKVDFDKIKMDIDKAMKQIDVAKIEQGVKSALKEIDWNTMNRDVKLSLQDAKKEIEKINMAEIKKEIEKAKLEIEKSRKELKNINLDGIMKNANAGITKAKEELRLTKEMFNEMEKEGLISQKDGFTIEFKNKDLLINGKKQSDAITSKYRQYIKEDSFKISISKE